MAKKTAIIYSFNSIKSKNASEKIFEAFGKNDIEPVNAEDVSTEVIEKYDNIIVSVPTWFDGELPNYWDEFMPDLKDMNLENKRFAIFGLGDQKGYPENFCDAIGIMAEALENCDAKIVGEVPIEGYTFESSRAVKDGKFVGLPLDQENQARKSKKRIEDWVKILKEDFV